MINVVIIDDQELVRTGIVRMLSDQPDINVAGEGSTGEDAIRLVRELSPNVILMDINMPGIGGLEATRKLSKISPSTRILALSVHGGEIYPEKLLNAGASGYITKGIEYNEMISAIRQVHAGKRYLTKEIAQQLALNALSPNKEKSLFAELSERELQITLMVTRGEEVKLIAEQLCISPKTVNSYRYRVFEKLDVHNDVQLTHLALLHGLITVNGSAYEIDNPIITD